MPMDLTVHFPEEPRTETVPDAISFDIEFGSENTILIDQTGGRAAEYVGIGLTVSAGVETDDSYFE